MGINNCTIFDLYEKNISKAEKDEEEKKKENK